MRTTTKGKSIAPFPDRIAVFLFFLVFVLISRWTPVAGDDWVYANSGNGNNPFLLTINQYHSWSGRILSEFWGFTVAPHKWLWNILNPLLFTGILILLLVLATGNEDAKESEITFLPPASAALAIALVFSVPAGLRMQTYTWMMGTTYVVPLFLFLMDLVLLRRYLSKDSQSSRRWIYVAMCLLNLMVTLYMENAAALMVGADLLLLLYSVMKKDQRLGRAVIVPFVFAVIGAFIILMSPGAHARMAENAEFASYSIGEKIAVNWPNFLEHTFSNNSVIMRVMFLLAALVVLLRGKRAGSWLRSIPLALPFLICMILNLGLLDFLGVLYGLVLLVYFRRQDAPFSDRCIFLILCALGADLVMLLSPIFDSRSSLYSVYLWILLILVLFSSIEIPRRGNTAVLTVMLCLSAIEGAQYLQLYHTVGMINTKRQGQLTYYAANPDVSDVWILGFPKDSIHSADVVDGDTVHDEAFKTYYGLNPDSTLHFYYLKDYSAQSIAEN